MPELKIESCYFALVSEVVVAKLTTNLLTIPVL